MSLGVAIPTYIKHVSFLQPLLDNITTSTVKPDTISVSCSSVHVNKDVEFEVNSVPVIVQYSTETLNPSQNRNKAASRLNTDLISFIDGDDLMHPRRLEFVKNVFLDHPEVEAVYHGYDHKDLSQKDVPFEVVETPHLFLNQVVANPNFVGISLGDYHIHHAHVTLRKSVFDRFQFDENPR